MKIPYSKTDILPFGKHKDETVFSVIVHNVSYITWCIENISGFELDNDAYEFYETFLENNQKNVERLTEYITEKREKEIECLQLRSFK